MAKRSIAEFHARADLDASQFEKGAQGMASSMSDTVQQIEKSLGMLDMAAVKSAQRTASVFGKEGIRPIDVSGAEKSLLAGQEAAAQRRMELNDQISQSMTRRVSEEMRAFTALAQAQSASNSLLADQLRQEEAASQRRIQLTRGVMTARIQSIQNASEYERGVERSVALMREANAQEAIKDQQRLTDAISRTAAIQNQLNSNIGISTSLARFDPSQSAFNDLPANFASLAPKAQKAAYAVSSVNTQLRKSRVGMMDFGVITQQAGYQVQDFAVQVAGGQSALVALSQQGSQMLGFFGPAGAIAGAVLAVGVLASRIMDTASQMKAAKEEAKKLAEQLERIRDLKLETARDGLSPGDLNQAIIADKQIAEEAYKRQRDIVSDLEQKISAQSEKALIEKGISQTREATGPITPINNLKKNLATEKKLLLDLEEAYEKARQPAEKAKREINDSINKEAGAFQAQKTANAEAAMTGTERQADIQRQIDLLKEKGQTETAEYAKLVGQQEQYARSLKQITTENSRFGEEGVDTWLRLQAEMASLNQNTVEYQEKLKQSRDIFKGYETKADSIKDRIDPMIGIKKQSEEIGRLYHDLGLLTKTEAQSALDQLIKSPEIPSALRTNAGASSLGGTAVNGSQVMDVAKSTLEEVKKLVEEARKQTRMWAGAN